MSFGTIASAHVVPAGGAFAPSDLPNLELWLPVMSDPSSVTASGGLVTVAADASANGRDFAPAATAPAYGSRTINSVNVLDFGTGAAGLRNLSGPTISVGTVAMVLRIDTIDLNGSAFEGGNFNVFKVGTNTGGTGVVQMLNGTNVSIAGAGVYDVAPIVVVAVFNTTSSDLRIDGVSVATGDSGSNSTNGEWGLGARANGSGRYFDGAIGEVVVSSSALAGTDLSDLETYMIDLAGL